MGILRALFGGSKSRADNQAFPQLQSQLTPGIQAGVGGITQLGNELGGGFDDYLDKSGFNFAAGEGLKGIAGSNAARGLLRSGASSRAFGQFMEGLRSQRYDNFLNQVRGLGELGIGAASTLTSAGQRERSRDSGEGIIGTLFSDRSVKTDVVELAEIIPGLSLYSFRYKGLDLPVQMGFMADEVEKLFPEAVGEAHFPITGDVRKTVNYEYVLERLRGEQKEPA